MYNLIFFTISVRLEYFGWSEYINKKNNHELPTIAQ